MTLFLGNSPTLVDFLMNKLKKSELEEVVKVYNQKYQTNFDNEIKDTFAEEVSRLVLKMINKSQPEED